MFPFFKPATVLPFNTMLIKDLELQSSENPDTFK